MMIKFNIAIVFIFLSFCLFGSEQKQGFIYVLSERKSGSSTLVESFKAIGYKADREHTLYPESVPALFEMSKKEPILIIESTREPIARRTSYFFEYLEHFTQLSPQEILENYKKDKNNFINFLITKFNQSILDISKFHVASLWKNLGYDYLNDGLFDHEKQYQLVQLNNFYFLNLRFDDINNWEHIIKSLPVPFDFSSFVITPKNLSSDKFSKEIYICFLKNITISKADFNHIVEHDWNHLIHFYTHDELENFKNHWIPYLIDP